MSLIAPIQAHIDALGGNDGYPGEAVEACLARPEQSVPLLRALLQRAARGMPSSDAEAAQLFLGLHILAQQRDTQSFPLLMRLLLRPYDEVEDLLGDALTETLPRVAASLFDGEAEDLFGLIADASVDAFIREALWGTATYLVFDGRIARETMRAFILRFDTERLAPKGDMAWVGWLGAIAHLGFTDLVPGIGSIWIDQRLPQNVMERRHFDADLAAALKAPDDIARFERLRMGTIDDVEKAVAWADWNGPPAPILNPMRDVGRNDPCPCGSGKKAKKCCLVPADG